MNNKNMFAGWREQEIFDYLYSQSLRNGKLMPLGRLLERAAHMFAQQCALIFKDEEISYEALYDKAAFFSTVLHRSGIRPHDRVILLFENSIEFYVGYWAIVQIGAVVVPLNSFLHEKEFSYIITNAQPRGLVISDEFFERLSKVEDLSLPEVFTPADMYQNTQSAVPEVPFFDLEPDDVAVLLYTSGTTGFPKGVMLSSKNCITNVFQVIARAGMGIDPHERIFAVLPLFHSFAQNTCVWATVFTGTTVILVPKIDRHLILQGLEKKPTVFLGVPALYGFLCLLKTAPLSSIKYFISGGDVLPDKIRTAFSLLYRRKICSGYGLTETAPVISIELNDEMYPSNTVGRLVVGMQAVIKDEAGVELRAPGAIGELFVKGDNVMLGYYDAPEITNEVLHNGWLATGDLAYYDHKKRLVIVGRIKDLIIHKGFNIYPQEIENVLLSHPLVMRAAVIGKEEHTVGEVPIAFVQIKEEDATIEKQLADLCEKNLASYKIPRDYIYTTKDLPTTATGKVDKKKLRATLKE